MSGRRQNKLFVVIVDRSVNFVSADVILVGHVVNDDVISGDVIGYVTLVHCRPHHESDISR